MMDVMRLSLPLTFWLIAFSGLYGLHATLCVMDWVDQRALGGLTWGRSALVLAWAVSIAVQAGLLVALSMFRDETYDSFIRRVSIMLAVVALMASIWTLSPIAFLPMCS